MTDDSKILASFAKLLSYPEADLREHAEFLESPQAQQQGDANMLAQFPEFVRRSEHTDIEEIFTRTFDMNAACCLEIGWHLYGEDYRRGEFLVQMRQSLAEENLPESGELPDHISHCLLLLARLELEDGREFTKSYLLPAIEKIRHGFKGKETNPYRNVVDVLHAVLRKNYDIADLQHPALKVLNNGPLGNANHQVNDDFIV